MFQLNLDAINKVYKELASNKTKLGKLAMKKTIDLVTVKAEIVLVTDALHCYGMSKMTVVDEYKKKMKEKYNLI